VTAVEDRSAPGGAVVCRGLSYRFGAHVAVPGLATVAGITTSAPLMPRLAP
jgi:hypothetical protein